METPLTSRKADNLELVKLHLSQKIFLSSVSKLYIMYGTHVHYYYYYYYYCYYSRNYDINKGKRVKFKAGYCYYY